MTCPHVRAGWWCRFCHGFAALLLVIATVGCGAAQAEVAAETARAAVCVEAESRVADAYEAGEVEQAEAVGQVACIRAVCDALHDRLGAEEEADDE